MKTLEDPAAAKAQQWLIEVLEVDTVQKNARGTLGWKLLHGAIQSYELTLEDGWRLIAGDMGTGKGVSETEGKDVIVGKYVAETKTAWLAVRGTENRLAGDVQWLGDYGNIYMPLEQLPQDDVRAHKGFKDSFLKLKEKTWAKIHEWVGKGLKRVLVTGHSRGSAIMTILSYVLATDFPDLQIDAVGWAPPRPGSADFQTAFSNLSNLRYIGFRNEKDIVASIPPEKSEGLVHALVEHRVCGLLDEGSKDALEKDGFFHVSEPIPLDGHRHGEIPANVVLQAQVRINSQKTEPLTAVGGIAGAWNIHHHGIEKYRQNYGMFFQAVQNSGLLKSTVGAVGKGGHLLGGVYSGIISFVLAYPDTVSQQSFHMQVDKLQCQQMGTQTLIVEMQEIIKKQTQQIMNHTEAEVEKLGKHISDKIDHAFISPCQTSLRNAREEVELYDKNRDEITYNKANEKLDDLREKVAGVFDYLTTEDDGPLASSHLAMVFEMAAEILTARFSIIDPNASVPFKAAFFAPALQNLRGRIVSRVGAQRLQKAILRCGKALASHEAQERAVADPQASSDVSLSTLLLEMGMDFWHPRAVVTASDDNTAKIWDPKTGTCTQTLSGHGDAVLSAAFSPDGSSVITASGDNTAKIWDPKTGTCTQTLSGHGDAVSSAAFSPASL